MKVRQPGGLMSAGSGRAGDRLPTYGRGRVCESPGCSTFLSAYNPARYCALHAAADEPRPRPHLVDRPLTP